jgi:hypothetical protein
MPGDNDSDFDGSPDVPYYSAEEAAADRRDWIQFCRSSLDLLNRTPLLCGDLAKEVELPDGKHVQDQWSSTGWLLSPHPDLTPVATSVQAIGLAFSSLPGPLGSAFLLTSLGVTLGHAGLFDYQREGNMVTGYVQHREYRDVSNFNIGVLGQRAGIPEPAMLYLAGGFALFFSSNAMPDKPYFQDPRNVYFIQSGYAAARSGAFDQESLPRVP